MTTNLTHISDTEIAAWRCAVPRAFGRPLAERLGVVAGWCAFAGVIVFGLWRMDFTSQRLWQGLWKLGWLLQLMFLPWHGGWLGEFSYAMLQTLAMAFLDVLLAGLAAVPLGFLGARNVVAQVVLHFGLRRFFDGIRGIDALIWALMFVNVVGLGPFAGVMAIAVSDTGTLAKLFAEAIENVDRRQIDGVRATGANRLLSMRFGILLQGLPVALRARLLAWAPFSGLLEAARCGVGLSSWGACPGGHGGLRCWRVLWAGPNPWPKVSVLSRTFAKSRADARC
jgi:phosphonate transport system permease protein